MLRLSVGAGRHAVPGLEAGAEIALGGEAEILGDLGDGVVRVLQHLGGVAAFLLLDVY